MGKKLTALTEITSILKTAIAYVVNTPGGTPASKFITVSNLLKTAVPLRVYEEGAAASTPSSGQVGVYAKTDGLVYSKDDAGDETLLSGGLGTSSQNQFEARLTLTTATPVTTSDVTAATSIFVTPYNGNQGRLYNGSIWPVYTISETEILLTDDTQTGDTHNASATLDNLTDTSHWIVGGAVTGVGIPGGTTVLTVDSSTQITMSANATADGTGVAITYTDPVGVIDLFAYGSGSDILYEKVAWTDVSTRATALTTQDGVDVETGATTRRYIGTYYVDTAGQTNDSLTKRHVFNHDHKAERVLTCSEGTNHNYATSTARLWNNSTTGNQLGFVFGTETKIEYETTAFIGTGGTSAYAYCRIYADGAFTNRYYGSSGNIYVSSYHDSYSAVYLGYHYIQTYEIISLLTGTFERMWMQATAMM